MRIINYTSYSFVIGARNVVSTGKPRLSRGGGRWSEQAGCLSFGYPSLAHKIRAAFVFSVCVHLGDVNSHFVDDVKRDDALRRTY